MHHLLHSIQDQLKMMHWLVEEQKKLPHGYHVLERTLAGGPYEDPDYGTFLCPYYVAKIAGFQSMDKGIPFTALLLLIALTFSSSCRLDLTHTQHGSGEKAVTVAVVAAMVVNRVKTFQASHPIPGAHTQRSTVRICAGAVINAGAALMLKMVEGPMGWMARVWQGMQVRTSFHSFSSFLLLCSSLLPLRCHFFTPLINTRTRCAQWLCCHVCR